eukprot:CAMPEP_0119128828 /NCGR_PEP_ID=MMETSP1310-20130426/6825_1 /TAXON_ID=464262 /ORGANISM="Genus nov. species nov., Strain RCC2339" /LENGTH=34 /DNA_ID= /DNA_START= /DNA_END= /DNA_ORIENTATION=
MSTTVAPVDPKEGREKPAGATNGVAEVGGRAGGN